MSCDFLLTFINFVFQLQFIIIKFLLIVLIVPEYRRILADFAQLLVIFSF